MNHSSNPPAGEPQSSAGDPQPAEAPHSDFAPTRPDEDGEHPSGWWPESVRRPGRVIPRDALLKEAGRSDVVVGERTVDVHISHLRQKLGDDPPKLIKTVRGVGYVLAKE